MSHYEFVSDYKEDSELRESFIDLARQVFDIDFTTWYEAGYWSDDYIPYSFSDKGKIIANVSVYVMSLIIGGKKTKAIQIGTVMTDPDYQYQGLSENLMKKVMALFKDEYDVMYLFANQHVLDYYPKFGFVRKNETLYKIRLEESIGDSQGLSKPIPVSLSSHRELLENIANNRRPLSTKMCVDNNQSLLLFYLSTVFVDNCYYIEALDTVLILEWEDQTCHLYDILSREPRLVADVIPYLQQLTEVILYCYFTIEEKLPQLVQTSGSNDDDALFVLSLNDEWPDVGRLPVTSHC